MDEKATRRVFYVTSLISALAVVFALFFQISKGEPFREVNPFLDDPYDAVGSIAFQGALLVGLLTFARALRLLYAEVPQARLQFITRGNLFVLAAVLVTLITDAIGEAVNPRVPSLWGSVLSFELAGMMGFCAICIAAFATVFPRLPEAALPRDLTPAGGIDDLWALIRIPLLRAGRHLRTTRRIERIGSEAIFSRIVWLNPRTHPWRFACSIGLSLGILVAAMQLGEGLPPNVEATTLLVLIFVGVELVAIVAGFVLFGGYLGLRPMRSGKNRAGGL